MTSIAIPLPRAGRIWRTRRPREPRGSYVARAWMQVQQILEANRVIRLAAYAMRASDAVYVNLAAQLAPERAMLLRAHAAQNPRFANDASTFAQRSTLPPAAVSGAMRRLIRPRGAVGTPRLAPDPRFTHGDSFRGLADGELTAAPPNDRQRPDDRRRRRRQGSRHPMPPPVVASMLRPHSSCYTGAIEHGGFSEPSRGFAALAFAAFVRTRVRSRRSPRAERQPASASSRPRSSSRAKSRTHAVRSAGARRRSRFVETDPVAPVQPTGGHPGHHDHERTSESPNAVRSRR